MTIATNLVYVVPLNKGGQTTRPSTSRDEHGLETLHIIYHLLVHYHLGLYPPLKAYSFWPLDEPNSLISYPLSKHGFHQTYNHVV